MYVDPRGFAPLWSFAGEALPQHGWRSTRGCAAGAAGYLLAPPDRLAARLILEDHALGDELVTDPIRLRPVLGLACGAARLDVLLDLGVADRCAGLRAANAACRAAKPLGRIELHQ